MPRSIKSLSQNSQRTYGVYANRFMKWLDGREPTLDEGEAFLEHLRGEGLARNTVSVAGRSIRKIYNLQVGVPSIEMLEPRYLTLAQVKKLIDSSPTLLDKTILILTFSTACRISEILNLTTDDLELDQAVARVTRKGGRRERVALGRQGVEALRIWLKARHSRSKRVFMDYNYNHVRPRLRTIAKKAGIPNFTIHMLRHSRVMHLRDSGLDWPDISEICGHTRTETTMKIYGRRKAEDRAKLLVDF